MNDQQLLILGEFYIKKGNYISAREIFSRLLANNSTSFQFAYLMGKIENKLGNTEMAIVYLEKAKTLNPFHKPTLLMLSRCYSDKSLFRPALECMVDAYLLSKETGDSRVNTYKNKIRKISKKVSHDMDDRQKNLLIKERLQYFNQQLQLLEQQFSSSPKADPADMAEITIAAIQEPEIPEPVTMASEISQTPISEPLPSIMDNSLMAEIDGHISESDVNEAEGIEDDDNFVTHDFPSSQTTPDFIHHILFKSLSVNELEKIRKFSTVQTFAKNEVIHIPLEPIYGFSCVLEGKVRIYHQGESLMELETGAIIDEAELCNGDKYFFETRAVEPSQILMVNKAALLTLCKRQHELAVHFLWHFYKSLSLKINSIFESIIYQNPSKDIIWSLDKLQEISNQRTLNELEIEYLSHRFPKTIKHKNDFIFKNHAPADTLYILLEGEVEMEHPYSREKIDIISGEFFSEIGLISNSFEHSMNAKVMSENAVYLKIDRSELGRLHDPTNRDNYRMMEILWNIFSRKYFEFLNFHFHLLKS